MSINVSICAHKEATIEKTGEKTLQVEKFNALQTPTFATSMIMSSDDRIGAYTEWAASRNPNHAEQFQKWIKEVVAKGYKIYFYVI